MSTHRAETSAGQRFEFGRNWHRFLNLVDADRMAQAERSLRQMLGTGDLHGKRFLDVGSGSGLFSLAARRLGARVCSFDYDPTSVACTADLRRRYFPDDADWEVVEGSVLDRGFLERIGLFDVVYSWGVLHHTGSMWEAIGNACGLVAPGGQLFIAIYNDQGSASRRWRAVKRLYNRSSRAGRFALTLGVGLALEVRPLLGRLVRLQSPFPGGMWRRRQGRRGMSKWTDLVDWVGGYPFEVATPEAVFDFCHKRGFDLQRLKTCGGGHGCNEYVFALRDQT